MTLYTTHKWCEFKAWFELFITFKYSKVFCRFVKKQKLTHMVKKAYHMANTLVQGHVVYSYITRDMYLWSYILCVFRALQSKGF